MTLVAEWPFAPSPITRRTTAENSPHPSSSAASPKAPSLSYGSRSKKSSPKKNKARPTIGVGGTGGGGASNDGGEGVEGELKSVQRRSGSEIGKAFLRKIAAGTGIGSKRHAMKVGGGGSVKAGGGGASR